jgi:hypothetical protein
MTMSDHAGILASMTEDQVKMETTKGYTFFPVFFSPAHTCKHDGCERLTTYGEGQYWHGGQHLLIEPVCWEHGYYEPVDHPTSDQLKQLKWERESITRFVIGSHDGQGKATVISPIPCEDVPGYKPTDPLETFVDRRAYEALHLEDSAWYVLYEHEGKPQYLYVVWWADGPQFELYKPQA